MLQFLVNSIHSEGLLGRHVPHDLTTCPSTQIAQSNGVRLDRSSSSVVVDRE